MSKRSTGVLVAMCLMVALFAFPAFAQAAPGSIEGTVTLGNVAVANASVEVFKWDESDRRYYFWDEASTPANGTFSFAGSVAETGTYFVRAVAATNTVEAVSEVFTLADDQTKRIGLALAKETFGPTGREFEMSWWTDSENYADDDVTFSLTMWDDHKHNGREFSGSGIATITYSINGGTEVATAQKSKTMNSLTVEGTATVDGVNTIRYFASDRNGNVGKTFTRLVYIDKSAPMTSYDMKAATGSSIMLVATDSGNGVASTYWRIGATGAFTPGNWVPVPATGVATLEFYSVDKAGNVEAVKSMTIQSRASLTKPKASTKSPMAGKTFYVRGAVVGKTAATGTLRVYKLVNGKYKYVSKKSFKESSAGTYKVAFKLKKGTYKFKAFYGANTATASNPPVNSVYSARSVVK